MSEDPTKLLKDDVQAVVELLKTERDDLKVRIHLAKAEAREEWEELEKKWSHLKDKTARLSHAATDASKDISAAAEILTEELKHGYQRIRAALKSDS